MTQPSNPQRQTAILMLLLGNLFWGLSFPLIRSIELLNLRLVPSGGAFETVYAIAPRYAIALVLLLALVMRRGYRVRWPEMKVGLVLAFAVSAGTLLQSDGLRFTAASVSAFLTQLYAILIPIWIAVRSRKNPGWVVWFCTAMVLAGVAILGRFDWATLRFGRGELETLASSLFFMVSILWLDKKEYADNRPGQVTLVMFVAQLAIFGSLALATAPNTHALLAPWASAPWLGLTLILATVCTIAPFTIMTTWQPKIHAIEAGLLYCTEPIFASILALFLPALFSSWALISYANERATSALLFGGALITVANAVIQLRRPATP